MKKLYSLISRNFQTMEKRVVPSSLGINNKHPMKRTVIRKSKNKKHRAKDHLFINKLASYLCSDAYMYNPLVSTQPCFDFPPPKQIVYASSPGLIQEDVALPVKGRNKKFVRKVVEFLEADCYLYSPLISQERVCSSAVGRSSGNGEEGRDLRKHIGARPVVKKAVASYRESEEEMFASYNKKLE